MYGFIKPAIAALIIIGGTALLPSCGTSSPTDGADTVSQKIEQLIKEAADTSRMAFLVDSLAAAGNSAKQAVFPKP